MKAFNLKALRHTSTELLNLAATESLQTQLERIEIIPYTTLPSSITPPPILSFGLFLKLTTIPTTSKPSGFLDCRLLQCKSENLSDFTMTLF